MLNWSYEQNNEPHLGMVNKFILELQKHTHSKTLKNTYTSNQLIHPWTTKLKQCFHH